IIQGVIDLNENFDALLAYPPIYPEYDRNRFQNGSESSRGFQGSASEMIGGGDDGFSFIHQLLQESQKYQIELISFLSIFKRHVQYSTKILQSAGRYVKILELKAGTRTRYIVLGKNHPL
ncbi:MAG: hypothetical protein ACXAD7_05845, partial [Candidatus Kariarchaeaceae archaeon]